jgi:long-chain fatty acid transport protein
VYCKKTKNKTSPRDIHATHSRLSWRPFYLFGRTQVNHPSRSLAVRATQLAFAAVLIIFTSQARAGAAWLTEAGGTDLGLAGAGRAALSLDAAALAANPAAIVGLPASTITAAVMPVKLDLSFSGSGDTPGSADNGNGIVPLGSLFAVKRSDRLALGVGIYSYLGLKFDLGTDWVGSRVIEKAGLQTINIAPTVAYRLTDDLDLGATVAAQYSSIDAALGISNEAIYYGPPIGMPDGRLEMKADSWAPGGSIGLVYRPSPGTSLGLAWTSPVHHTAGVDLHGHDLHPVPASLLPGPGQVEFDFTLPQQVTLGLTRQVTPATLVGASVGWQDWSAFGQATMRFPGQSAPLFADGLSDTWNASLGLRHATASGWGLAAGVSYDSDPSAGGSMPAYFPMAEQWRFAAGVDRQVSAVCTVRAALTIVAQGSVHVAQDSHPLPLPGIAPLTGTYEGSRIYMLALAADFRP